MLKLESLAGPEFLTFNANTTATFTSPFNTGNRYNVSVSQQPTGQNCSVGINNSGTIGSANVSISVTCITNVTPNFTVLALGDYSSTGNRGVVPWNIPRFNVPVTTSVGNTYNIAVPGDYSSGYTPTTTMSQLLKPEDFGSTYTINDGNIPSGCRLASSSTGVLTGDNLIYIFCRY